MAQKKKIDAPSPDLVRDEIREVAQGIFNERQAESKAGDELSDWLEAESKVKAKYKL